MLPLKEVQPETITNDDILPYTLIEELTYNGITYQRIKKNYKSFNYGEVVIDSNNIVPQYPSIYRCYNLKKALANHFQVNEKFIVEEKLDGYNVRIVNISNNIVAFTRGGFICPYTTEILENYPEIKNFLLMNYDKVLCAELVGENPYNTLSIRMYGEEPQIYIFDIMDLKNKTCKSRKKSFLIPVQEKLDFFNQYNLKTAPVYGVFTPKDYKTIRNIIIKSNELKKEGIVIKALDTKRKYIKFATPYADIEAITDHITKSFECDTAHFRKRLFLLASYALEFSYTKEDIFSQLGSKLDFYLTDVLRSNQKIEIYNITISEKNWIELEKLLSRTLKITILLRTETIDGKLRITFEKYYKKTSEFIKGANAGRLFVD